MLNMQHTLRKPSTLSSVKTQTINFLYQNCYLLASTLSSSKLSISQFFLFALFILTITIVLYNVIVVGINNTGISKFPLGGTTIPVKHKI